jgi:hypothetical protein
MKAKKYLFGTGIVVLCFLGLFLLKVKNMGLFSGLFGTSSNLERQLEEFYVPTLQIMTGMTPTQAKSSFRDILKQAKEEAEKEGTLNLPQNFGDILLEKESKDEKIKAMLARKRKEGVTDKDIRWWWNMHDLERRIMLKVDDIYRMALFVKLREKEGLNVEEAARRIGKSFPIFGDPNDTANTAGEDRPLPYELKDRINVYIEKRSQIDPERLKREFEGASSVNSFIRKEISKGNI